MDKQAIKNKIVANILNYGDQSFVGIEETFEEFSFEYKEDGKFLISPENNSIVLWHGWNDAAVEIVQEVMRESQIKLTSTSLLTYVADGRVMNMVIAQNANHHYKEARWLPMLFVKIEDHFKGANNHD